MDEHMAVAHKRAVEGPTISLGSGGYFDYCNPEGSPLTIEDVAYGLAYQSRFSGQCRSRATRQRVFYSVAEHCVRMSWAVPEEHAYDALMHDAGEAVCGDMPAPLKAIIPEFRAIEKRCERAAHARFKVPMRDRDLIKLFDLIMLATEQRDLTTWHADTWADTAGIEPLRETITPWDPNNAALSFLARYRQLRANFAHGWFD